MSEIQGPEQSDLEQPLDLSGDNQDFEPMTTEEATLVTLMRIYDVLLGMYSDMDEIKAEALMELHALGQLLGPVPAFDLTGEDEPNT